jgi:hypothetical protein
MSVANLCFNSQSYTECTFTVLGFFPTFATVFLAGYTFKEVSLETLLATTGCGINWLVNLALLYLIQDPVPRGANPYDRWESHYGMPAFNSQFFVFLFSFFLLFSLLYHQKMLPAMYIALTYIIGVLSLLGQVHYKQNTPTQLLVGGVVGAVVCVVYLALIDLLVVPYQRPLVRFFRRIFTINDTALLSRDHLYLVPTPEFFESLLSRSISEEQRHTVLYTLASVLDEVHNRWYSRSIASVAERVRKERRV